MNKTRLILIFVALLVVFGLVIGGKALLPKPADLCPNIDDIQAQIPDGMMVNSTGECLTVTTIEVMGAEPTFSDPDVQRILLDKKGWVVRVLTNSNLTEYKNENGELDFSRVQVIFGGSTSFPDELRAKYNNNGKIIIPTSGKDPINILGTKTTFSSPLIMYIKAKDAQVFLNSGLIEKNGDHYTISGQNVQKIAQANIEDKYWNSIGTNFPTDGLVRVGYPYPSLSGGGRTIFSYLFACALYTNEGTLPCSKTLTIETVNANEQLVSKIKTDYGSQPGGDNSVSYFFDWANSSQPGQRVVFGNESIIFSWITSPNVPASQRQAAMDSIIGVYPEYTFMTSQVAVEFTDMGKQLVDFMISDSEIVKIMNEKLGQRVGFGGTLPKLINWISTNDTFTVITDPSAETTGRVKELFK